MEIAGQGQILFKEAQGTLMVAREHRDPAEAEQRVRHAPSVIELAEQRHERGAPPRVLGREALPDAVVLERERHQPGVDPPPVDRRGGGAHALASARPSSPSSASATRGTACMPFISPSKTTRPSSSTIARYPRAVAARAAPSIAFRRLPITCAS